MAGVGKRWLAGALGAALLLAACGSSTTRAHRTGAGPSVGPYLDSDPTPHQLRDEHWHAAVAVNVCGAWQPGPIWPAVTSSGTLARVGTQQYAGLHTHTLQNGQSDGLIHMEPATADEAGRNATIGRWLQFGGWRDDGTSLALWDGADGAPITWHAGDRCTTGAYAGQPAVVRWARGRHRDGATTQLTEQHTDIRTYKLYDNDVIAIYVLPRRVALDGDLQRVPSEPNLALIGATTSPTTPSTVAAAKACPTVAAPKRTPARTYAAPGDAHLDPAKQYRATIETSCGRIVVALDVQHAPKGANNFAFLAQQHFYDGLTFHRAVRDFVIQGGDPNGDGSGGPGYSVPTEVPQQPYALGDLAWAKTATDPDGTAGSQFFIVTGAEALGLPLQYGVFGKVVDGLAVAKRIESESTGDGPPAVPVYIERVTITP